MPETLAALVDEAPDDAPALVFADEALTFGDLASRSARLARLLRHAGVGPGDRVALWMPNRPAWMVCALAAWRLGALLFPLNPRLRARDLGGLLAQSRAAVLMLEGEAGEEDWGAILREVADTQRADLRLVLTADAAPGLLPGAAQHAMSEADRLPEDPFDDADPEAGAVIFATSGTTGGPKLVLHGHARLHRQLGWTARGVLAPFEGARPLLTLPLSGAYGFSIAMTALRAQAPCYVQRRFDPGAAARAIDAAEITHLFGTDDMADKLLEAAPEGPVFPTLRFMGWARYTPSLTDLPGRAAARGLRLRGMYGMSEVLAFFAVQPEDAPAGDFIEGGGRPTNPASEIRVADPETGEVLPPDTPGELEIRSPDAFMGYLDNPQADAAAFREDGWFRTGDLARMRPDGRMIFLSRLKDVIRVGGWMVDPAEIEAVLREHPGVAAAQVVAVAQDRSVRPVACVIPRGEAPEEAGVIAHCRARLAIHKCPVRVLVVEDFPMTDGPNGRKVQRNVLRERVEARLAAEGETP